MSDIVYTQLGRKKHLAIFRVSYKVDFVIDNFCCCCCVSCKKYVRHITKQVYTVSYIILLCLHANIKTIFDTLVCIFFLSVPCDIVYTVRKKNISLS